MVCLTNTFFLIIFFFLTGNKVLCAGGGRGGFPGALPGVQEWDGEGAGGIVPALAWFARDPGRRFSGAGEGPAGPTRHRVSVGEGEGICFLFVFFVFLFLGLFCV